ncbi:MAG: hypothetical protein GX879_05065 [Bacteroidales bacterium]|nr:hypothetical protein [Bacteroidales bacterium]
MSDKVKIELEYPIRGSKKILFERLSTAGGLAEWFADDVFVKNNSEYDFIWDDESHLAEMISNKYLKFVRFRWLHLPKDTYFEFKLVTEELTQDTVLIITDFVDKNEQESATNLWENQINDLKRILGT